VDAILDWRDPDDLLHAHGAEAAYYRELTPPYHPQNGRFRSLEELLLVRGMTREILEGTVSEPARRAQLLAQDPAERAFGPGEYLGIRPLLSVHGSGRVNIQAAAAEVLMAFGIPPAEARAMVEARKSEAGLERLPPGAAGLVASRTSSLFAVVSQGRIEGSPVTARITAVVRNEGLPEQPRYRIVDWTEGV
jgi:general secretion pathway protein K